MNFIKLEIGVLFSQGLAWGFKGLIGVALAAIDQLIFRGKLPFTLNHSTPDYACTKKSSECKKIDYPKPDGIVSFDKLSSVFYLILTMKRINLVTYNLRIHPYLLT